MALGVDRWLPLRRSPLDKLRQTTPSLAGPQRNRLFPSGCCHALIVPLVVQVLGPRLGSTSDRRIRSSAGRCPAGRIWSREVDPVQGVQLSSLELGTNFGTKFLGPNLDPAKLLWQLAVESSVRDLIDGRRIGVARVMPDAEGEVAERKALVFTDEAKDHPELAVRSW